jgi:hypothetical protein
MLWVFTIKYNQEENNLVFFIEFQSCKSFNQANQGSDSFPLSFRRVARGGCIILSWGRTKLINLGDLFFYYFKRL